MAPKRKQPEKGDGERSFFMPLAHLPEAEQLAVKTQIAEKLKTEVRKEMGERAKKRGYLEAKFEPEQVAIAHLEKSATYAFRNKCEFSFGKDKNGDDELGFIERVGLTKFVVLKIEADNPIVHPAIYAVVQQVKTVLMTAFPVFDREKRTGLLRNVSVRMGRDDLCSLVVQIFHSGESDHVLASLVDKLALVDKVVSKHVLFNLGLTDSCQNKPLCVTPDQPAIPMRVLGLDFAVQPSSFFQTNSAACALLYGLVADWALGVDQRSRTKPLLVFDLCCGVGTIGQVLARRALDRAKTQVKVVGVDIVVEAIEDARANAKSNFGDADEVQLEFIAGRAEEVVGRLIKEHEEQLTSSEVVCVVDPPRAGLHPSVLRCLRQTESIDRIIYVSCNWESLARDLVTLCEYVTDVVDDPGVTAPFRCVKLQPVDMFPLTEHCEMLIELVRSRPSV